MNTVVVEEIERNIQDVKGFTEDMRNYLLNPKGKVDISTLDYTELEKGLKIKDITSQEQYDIGITILKVIVTDFIELDEHLHQNQSQFIYVKKGQIYNIESNVLFKEGQSLAIFKSNLHRIRYYPGTECVIVYMPKL